MARSRRPQAADRLKQLSPLRQRNWARGRAKRRSTRHGGLNRRIADSRNTVFGVAWNVGAHAPVCISPKAGRSSTFSTSSAARPPLCARGICRPPHGGDDMPGALRAFSHLEDSGAAGPPHPALMISVYPGPESRSERIRSVFASDGYGRGGRGAGTNPRRSLRRRLTEP